MFESQEKVREEIRGSIGSVAQDIRMPMPQRETAKMQMKRAIDRLRHDSEKSHKTAVEMQALYNELPELLSPQADAALHDLLSIKTLR